VLTDAQRRHFDEWGYCLVESAFDRVDAAEMAAAVLQYLDRELGVRRDDPTTWRDLRGGAHFTRLVQTGVFMPVATARLHQAIDGLLGPAAWTDRRGWGTPLVTLPGPPLSVWDVPSAGWHTDFPCWPAASALRMFAYLNDVRPQGAGTLVVAGSHGVAAWAERHPQCSRNSSEFKKSLRRSNAWFADLLGQHLPWGTRKASFMNQPGEAFGVPVRVAELSANAGDVVLWHPSLLHAEAPNATYDPRLMLTHTVHCQ
jgi:ectoine hydroxylase-related dioxygenase (phytanoyl-CoA dioxygenase family)